MSINSHNRLEINKFNNFILPHPYYSTNINKIERKDMAFNLWGANINTSRNAQNDYANMKSSWAHPFKKAGGWIGNLGTALGAKEYGISELLGGDIIGSTAASEGDQPIYGPVSGDYGQKSMNNDGGLKLMGDELNGGDTDGGDTTPPFLRYLGGTQYTDPIAYANAVTEASMTEYKRQNKLLTDAYNAGLLEFGQYQDMLKQSRENVKLQHSDALSGISGKYSSLSPEAIQSSQANAEQRTGDITNQNYANIAGQEANLGLQRANYESDFANNLEANRIAQQNQFDKTINSTIDDLAGTSYANRMGEINAPKLNVVSPIEQGVLGIYDKLSGMKGNLPAIRETIDRAGLDKNISDWLWTRFGTQQQV